MKRGKGKRGRGDAEPELIRFGISIPADLLKKFDELLTEKKNQNRSEAIRDLIRDRLVQDAWNEGKGEQVAVVTLTFETQNIEAQRRLAEGKRALGERMLASTQVRVSPQQDMEIVTLLGQASTVRADAEALIGTKGILHGKFVMTTPGSL
ncbi:MAG TPA: nickel-responsive transcriptional regulator NikR [Planctomycetota bacterium]|nr:nickel-responsive transcriptional regulator NikR [Planctomycetota bacterium]